jgi:hypothetical protein
MKTPVEKQRLVEKTGYFRWLWGDRDYGPNIDGFDPDDAFKEIPDGTKVKVRIEITILEE